MQNGPMRNLCRFATELTLERIPPEIVSRARLVALDTLGVIVAGSSSHEAAELGRRVSGNGVLPEASCLGRSLKAAAADAALLNGTAGSTLEFEEGNSHAAGHPAIQLIPAVLAQSEKTGAPGREFLAGVIAGYECACRVSRASALRQGMHPNGSWGTVGAALGAGRVGKGSGPDLFGIANIAASFAITPYVKNSFAGQSIAATFAGVSNYFGILSNTLYECGFRADEASLAMTFSRFISDRFQEDCLDEGLGQRFFIGENYFKPYPSCRFTHPPLDALKAIMEEGPFAPDEVEEITVGTFPAGMHCGPKAPANMESARFSTPYLLAILMSRGNITPEILGSASAEDPALKELAARVKMETVPEYEKVRPAQSPAAVTVKLKSGRRLRREVMTARGEGPYVFGEDEVAEKFLSLAAPVVGEERATAFLDRWAALEREEDVSSCARLLCP